MSGDPLPGGGRRHRRDRHDRSGNNGPEKKPKFEMVVVLRERQMTVEIPILGSSRPAVSSGSRGAQCPISDCPVMDQKDKRLSAICLPSACHLQRRTP